MLRYLMKLRHRKGFTLTELVIVIAILGLLMACVAAFASPVRDMVKQTASSTDALAANKIIGDYIENRLAFANRIDTIYAVDLTSGLSEINDTYVAFQNLYNAAGSGTKDKAGVLIFHYDENTNEPEKSTYKLYDIPVESSGTFAAAVIGTGGVINGEVFDDAFYVNSQNLIIAPTTVSSNKLRNTLFAEFKIIPYDCDEDYLVRSGGVLDTTNSLYIKGNTLDYYYEYQENYLADPALYPDDSFGLDTISPQRSGAIENISFELRNMEISSYTSLPGVDGLLNTADDILTPDVDGWNPIYPGGCGGKDILIYYYIPHY